jgi:pseudouridine-5'-phosphate glycosidase/pseudouridine kinase
MADMSIFDNESFKDYWRSAVESAKPKWLVIDGNWSENGIRDWVAAGRENGCNVAFEPVSTNKSMRLFCPDKGKPKLRLYPEASISLSSPNTYELAAMYSAAKDNGYLESHEWFEIIDAFGMRGARDRFVHITSAALTDAGVPVQTVQLLPYIPTIITKLGADGVLLTTLLKPDDPRLRNRDEDDFILARTMDGHPTVGGIYMRLYPPAEKVDNIVSVNGVGDTFLGVLISGLAQGGRVENLINVAQKGSVLTLKSQESVSPSLNSLEEELSRAVSKK